MKIISLGNESKESENQNYSDYFITSKLNQLNDITNEILEISKHSNQTTELLIGKFDELCQKVDCSRAQEKINIKLTISSFLKNALSALKKHKFYLISLLAALFIIILYSKLESLDKSLKQANYVSEDRFRNELTKSSYNEYVESRKTKESMPAKDTESEKITLPAKPMQDEELQRLIKAADEIREKNLNEDIQQMQETEDAKEIKAEVNDNAEPAREQKDVNAE